MLVHVCLSLLIFFFKQKTAYEMRISDWSSDVCSSDLEDGRSLSDYNIQNDSTIHMVLRLRGSGMQIFIKTLSGNSIELTVCASDTVESVKWKIQDEQGIPPYKQRLVFASNQLAANCTLADCGIKAKDGLHLIVGLK